jgi:ribosome-binding protein aMBF1 (putative translation factor)
MSDLSSAIGAQGRRKPRRATRNNGKVAALERELIAIDVDSHVGRRLRRRRRLLGLTQVDLARACGTSFQQIQKYECAAARMSIARLWRLAGVLGVDFGYFFEGLPPLRRPDDGPGEGVRSFAPSERPARGAG